MIISLLNRYNKRKRFREQNKNNTIQALNDFDIDRVKVGNYTYGGITNLAYDDSTKLSIGNFVSIAPGVTFISSADHSMNTISTFPFKAKILTGENEATSKGDIEIDDDVWIGQNAIILSGVHISQGAVVAAGSVVNMDVPPYAIVGGVPAKVLKYRFEQDVIEFLLTLDYSQLSKELIEKNVDNLYLDISTRSKNELKDLYKWFPKKV